MGDSTLTRLERAQIHLVRASLRPGALDRAIRALQRTLGQWWIRAATAKLRHVHGLERLPAWDRAGSVILRREPPLVLRPLRDRRRARGAGASAADSFPGAVDVLLRSPARALRQRRDELLRDVPAHLSRPKRAALNLASLDEVAALLRRGGFFVGLHPEGTRKKDDDPYTFLPAQSGVGRVIHKARVPVVPVFVNGLGNDSSNRFEAD